jgi:hypothetical protein
MYLLHGPRGGKEAEREYEIVLQVYLLHGTRGGKEAERRYEIVLRVSAISRRMQVLSFQRRPSQILLTRGL